MSTVRELLSKRTRTVYQVGENETVLAAARLMKTQHIGCVVVTRQEKVIGIFTERDVLMRVVAEGRDPATVCVGQVMTSPVEVCTPDTTLDECVGNFTSKRHRHLPVVEDGRLVGLISSGDLLASQVREHQTTIMYLKEYMFSAGR